jgi:membrane-anchored protein YejM (alkaline phosphatase superfamily)
LPILLFFNLKKEMTLSGIFLEEKTYSKEFWISWGLGIVSLLVIVTTLVVSLITPVWVSFWLFLTSILLVSWPMAYETYVDRRMFKPYSILPPIIWTKIIELIQRKRLENKKKGINKFTADKK